MAGERVLKTPRKNLIYSPPSTERVSALVGLPLASFTCRALALMIDFLIAAAGFVVIFVGGTMLLRDTGLVHFSENVDFKFTFFGNWYSVTWLVMYFALFLYWGKGRTPGKRICRIRVVSLTHEHLGFWHSLERALGYGASALEFGFGFFQYSLRSDRQTVHDRIAETIVISDRLKPGGARSPHSEGKGANK